MKFRIEWIPKNHGAFDTDICGTDYNHNYSIIIWVADSKFYLVCHVNDNQCHLWLINTMDSELSGFRLILKTRDSELSEFRIKCEFYPNKILEEIPN